MTDFDVRHVQFEILKGFPFLVPMNENFSRYEGFIEVKGLSFRVSLEAPNYPSSVDVSLNCEWKLSEILNKHRRELRKLSGKQWSLDKFLEKLSCLISSSLNTDGSSHLALEGDTDSLEEKLDNLRRCRTILAEVNDIGTNNLVSISTDFRAISLRSYDTNGDPHTLNLKLCHDQHQETFEKYQFEVFDTDLPEIIIKIIQKESNISKAYHVFCEQIGILSRVWDSLSILDKQSWVIDPTHPRKADMYRRISISPANVMRRVMAQLSWDPLKPQQPPEIKFQGPDAEIHALRCTYEEHLEDWDDECNILDNLCAVLQLSSLPEPPPPETSAVSQTVETGECVICYSVKMDGKLPEESCGHCLSNFHATCLFEWFENLPGSRQVHGHISGLCPNCEISTIKCPCPHT